MSKVFDAITSGLSRFVLSWAIPSALAVGVFAVFVLPAVRYVQPFKAVADAAGSNPLQIAAVLGFAVATLAVLFAYTDLPIYRLLEGYTLPRSLRNRLQRRQLRRWTELDRFAGHSAAARSRRRISIDDRLLYPERRANVLPTRLGNALRALETYGGDRFGLDSQTFWHELVGCAPVRVKEQVDHTRGAVDLFVSSVAHLTLLGLVSVGVGLFAPKRPDWQAIVVGTLALMAVPLAYRSAVRSVLDWRLATQALIHTGRSPLARQMGFGLPASAEAERKLWIGLRKWVIERHWSCWVSLDKFRLPAFEPADVAGSEPADGTSSTMMDRS